MAVRSASTILTPIWHGTYISDQPAPRAPGTHLIASILQHRTPHSKRGKNLRTFQGIINTQNHHPSLIGFSSATPHSKPSANNTLSHNNHPHRMNADPANQQTGHQSLTHQNPLLNQVLRPRPTLQLLLQTISPHMLLQLPLLLLQRRRRTTIRQDIALDELFFLRTVGEPLYAQRASKVSGTALVLHSNVHVCVKVHEQRAGRQAGSHTFFKLSVILCLSSSAALACRAGAAVVSRRIWRFLRSASSGLCCKAFSRELRRSEVLRMGASSMLGAGVSSDMMGGRSRNLIAVCAYVCVCV